MAKGEQPPERSFPFREWVRETCRRAIVWGIGVIVLLGGVSWFLRDPESEPLSRAFGTLLIYGTLFLVSLAKIWWTAGGAAVVLEEESLAYQPLHTFWPKRIPLGGVLSCAPRTETQSLRFVYESSPGRAREFFLNLGLIRGRTAFLTQLGEVLHERGLEPVAGQTWAWARPTWSEIDAN